MKNYHYYLKQEIYSNEKVEKRFNGMVWHPEDAFTLYIIGQGESIFFQLFKARPCAAAADTSSFRSSEDLCLGYLLQPSSYASGQRNRGRHRWL
jgi:elongator complex protein 1